MSARTHGKGSPRLAEPDLPPTLQPNAIRSAAPPPNRRLSAILSSVIYLGCAGLMVSLANAKALTKPGPITLPVTLFPDDVPPLPPATDLPLAPPMHTVSVKPPEAVKPEELTPVQSSTEPPVLTPTTFPKGGFSTPVSTSPDGFNPSGRISDTRPSNPQGSFIGGTTELREISMDQLRVLHQEPSVYPVLARIAKIEGTVELLMVINEQGIPVSVHVVSGPQQLHAEAERSAKLWRFEPARVDGRPVSARFRLSLVFRLKR